MPELRRSGLFLVVCRVQKVSHERSRDWTKILSESLPVVISTCLNATTAKTMINTRAILELQYYSLVRVSTVRARAMLQLLHKFLC